VTLPFGLLGATVDPFMKMRVIAIVLLLVGVGVGLFSASPEKFPFRLGLDLSGGTLLTYKADVSGVENGEVGDAMDALRDVIERRVNLFGVSEPLVQVEESSVFGGEREQRLIVELPGVTNVDEAVRTLGETPLLEFKLLTSDLSALSSVGEGDTDSVDVSNLYTDTGLTGRFLKRASLEFQNATGGYSGSLTQEPAVVLEFDTEGATRFAEITRDNVGEVLAVFLDGVPITQPVIQTEIPNGTAVITGSFTPEEARDLARNLNFGALPVPIGLIGTQTVGAALGADILGSGVAAGIWGLGLVALFVVLWYRLPGVISVLALGVYVVVMLALFKLIPVTLTAAGIAGFVLSIGMAVDANILIFERLKEEINRGHSVGESAREGFSRAWPSIRDGNLSTLITAVILFWFGTSIVEGFALVLGMGVLVSMLTAITVTRTLLLSVVSEKTAWVFKSGIK